MHYVRNTEYNAFIVVKKAGSYVGMQNGRKKPRSKHVSELLSKVGGTTGNKNFLLAYLKCMEGVVLAFLK